MAVLTANYLDPSLIFPSSRMCHHIIPSLIFLMICCSFRFKGRNDPVTGSHIPPDPKQVKTGWVQGHLWIIWPSKLFQRFLGTKTTRPEIGVGCHLPIYVVSLLWTIAISTQRGGLPNQYDLYMHIHVISSISEGYQYRENSGNTYQSNVQALDTRILWNGGLKTYTAVETHS